MTSRFRSFLASRCRKIKRKSRYQGTKFALRIKSSIYVACLQITRKNSIVQPRDIADDPASLAFEAIETIIWKLPIALVVRIISKYFETTGAIGTIRTIIWKPGLMLCCTKNRRCESSRVTSPLSDNDGYENFT